MIITNLTVKIIIKKNNNKVSINHNIIKVNDNSDSWILMKVLIQQQVAFHKY